MGADKASFLERYSAQKGIGQDSRSGFYLDLEYRPTDDQTFTVKRWGQGQYRHGGEARWDSEQVRFTAGYNFIRRSTGGLTAPKAPPCPHGGNRPKTGIKST